MRLYLAPCAIYVYNNMLNVAKIATKKQFLLSYFAFMTIELSQKNSSAGNTRVT